LVHAVRTAGHHGGFTLLEVLVVVVIIAVMTTIAMLSIGVLGTDRELDAEGDRFSDVVAAATEQSQLEGRDFGIWFGPARYQVLTYVQRTQLWDSVADDRLYESHELPAGLQVAVELEGRPVPLGAEQPGTPRVPQVLLYSSGDASPYRLVLTRDGSESRWLVDGQPDGTLVVTRPGAAP
jgi:general secretion pathway protein H